MAKHMRLWSLLLVTSALVAPTLARAQSGGGAQGAGTQSSGADAPAQAAPPAVASTQADAEEQVDVSIPGANNAPPGGDEIVVTGRRTINIQETAPQVVSVLSSADIARTGEGNIAGALGRVTGLSVVGGGFVYVRGLGDRYSLALLNGSPLPSPEPLRRVVPLDLFPTGVIASSLVQKTYSANFPGEFGGGVINLTTKAVPKEPFLTAGISAGLNTETTGQLGYTYFGTKSDFTGFSGGGRGTPPALAAYLASGNRISTGTVNTQAIASELVRGRFAVVQRNGNIPANLSASVTGGTTFDLGGDVTLGVIATGGYSNTWRTRDTVQQTGSTQDLSQRELDFRRVITDNRIVANALVGYGLDFGDNRLRWTNLYIRDTLKQARLGIGTRESTSPVATLQQQDTAWFERQLINSQIVGEFKPFDDLSIDARIGYANSKRRAPNELSFEYFRSNVAGDPFGEFFVNRLNNGQRGNALVSYSRLREDLYSGGVDLTYTIAPRITATVGYAYNDTQRRTERRDFQFSAPSAFPTAVGLFRPDFLLQPSVINQFGITLVDTNEANPVFDASLRVHAGYGQLQAEITEGLSLNIGARYEVGLQTVAPVQVFTVPTASLAGTNLNRNYLLPAATLTWEFADRMQLRANVSKTIARPQFRELIFQFFYDPDGNRQFRGNPLLTDSQLYNGELRYEWYFARDQRLSLSGFYKRIDRPIESFVSVTENSSVTSFANAPKADLYGGEVELQKYFDLGGLGGGDGFFATRRAVAIANYTYTASKIKVGANDPATVFASAANRATDYFIDGQPLTGQSDHLVNLQMGLEDTDNLSQQTLLFSYASRRVTSRGASGQPDIFEIPGIRLDFVAREGLEIAGKAFEVKFEVRNLTGTQYQEVQTSGANRIFFNRYRIGTSASLGVSVDF